MSDESTRPGRAGHRAAARWPLIASVIAGLVAIAWPQATPLRLLLLGPLAAGWLVLVLWRRRSGWSADEPGETVLVSRKRLLLAGDEILARCRGKRQPLSLAVVELADFSELRKLFGGAVAEQMMTRLARKLEKLAGSRGFTARTGPAQFAVLLPGRAAEQALVAMRAAIGGTGCLEDDREELVLLPEFKLDAVGPEHASIEPVYDALCDAMPAGTRRHSGTLATAGQATAVPAAYAATMPLGLQTVPLALQTVPMPLQAG